jgi:hypothetical protein
MAASEIWKRRMARGNQAIDGMVWMPVMREPKATRARRTLATMLPSTTPITREMPKPTAARRMVMAVAVVKVPSASSARRSAKTAPGPGRMYSGFQPDSTTACHSASPRASAASFGHVADQAAVERMHVVALGELEGVEAGEGLVELAPGGRRTGGSGRGGEVSGHGDDLRAQQVEHRAGQLGDLRRLDAPGPLDVDVDGGGHPTRPAGEHDDAVGQAGRLAHVVGDEEDGEAAVAPQRLELVVQQVAGHGVEGAERLVHEQHVGVLGEGAGQGDPLAHAAGQLVGPLAPEGLEVDGAEQRLHPRLALGPGHATELERELHVRPDREPREQGGVLEHEGGPALGVGTTGGRRVEPGDEVEQRALAAPRGADHAHELAAGDVEVDAVERSDGVAAAAVHLAGRPQRDGGDGLRRRVGDEHRPRGRLLRRPGHSPATSASPRSASSSFSRDRS